MELRELEPVDAIRCAELEELLFDGDNPWPVERFLDGFAAPYVLYLGIFEKDELVAYAGLARLGPVDDSEFEIHTIGVAPEYHRRGLSRVLMDQFMELADSADGPVFLEVRTDNVPAISLYKAYGFIQQGVRRNYYQPSGADAYTMMRPARSEK
ncbi:ribosomal protein S18-alanine N-acetyltransferase [Corynebacterium alimapuense]|uniref:[Ribosomal protein bS18]-alanine N-acetyltransferase n=1 Tax=Corynebacterium alimapuense TaxID=1576874 RepID=A0A3M8K6J3_9CORY|nr:ribosomal protein S18-alanine N-acetyltransferase [Corynebacterium alimapuense]RNE48841.1 ribosomal-protein-alanine N-acetyltransferase [Corynebacterium alimapuense]